MNLVISPQDRDDTIRLRSNYDFRGDEMKFKDELWIDLARQAWKRMPAKRESP
jgi:hypothetical protein